MLVYLILIHVHVIVLSPITLEELVTVTCVCVCVCVCVWCVHNIICLILDSVPFIINSKLLLQVLFSLFFFPRVHFGVYEWWYT